jgi:putative Ca2+/H+ antiporter (TMEM165/GDT1 family)
MPSLTRRISYSSPVDPSATLFLRSSVPSRVLPKADCAAYACHVRMPDQLPRNLLRLDGNQLLPVAWLPYVICYPVIMRQLLVIFFSVFMAEIGDKTQLATVLFATMKQ